MAADEEATMCQRRPADPTDPGDAADLSIMGCSWTVMEAELFGPHNRPSLTRTVAHAILEINSFLTNRPVFVQTG